MATSRSFIESVPFVGRDGAEMREGDFTRRGFDRATWSGRGLRFLTSARASGDASTLAVNLPAFAEVVVQPPAKPGKMANRFQC
jgi:hypothetical protein